MKSFYIAARPSIRFKEVVELNKFLVQQGLENAFDWTTYIVNNEVKRPYLDNKISSAEIGDRMMQSAFSADIFIHSPEILFLKYDRIAK